MNLSGHGAVVDKWAGHIARWGLATPAILFLELHKPLSFIGSQFLLFAQPFVSGWADGAALRELADLCADRAAVTQLIARLEQVQGQEAGELF